VPKRVTDEDVRSLRLRVARSQLLRRAARGRHDDGCNEARYVVVQSYSRTVVQSYSRTVVQSYWGEILHAAWVRVTPDMAANLLG